jgi:hypothetical protein
MRRKKKDKLATDPGKFCEAPVFFDFDLWKQIGSRLIRAEGDLQWEIGDWLIEGKDDGKMRDGQLRREAEDQAKRAWGTMKNYMVTARAVPKSRRRDGCEGRAYVPYAVHVEVGKFDADAQDELLEYASESNCSVAVIKRVIANQQSLGKLPSTVKPKKLNRGGGKVYQVWISDVTYERLKELASAKGVTSPEAVITWLGAEYLRLHKDEIEQLKEKWRAEQVAKAAEEAANAAVEHEKFLKMIHEGEIRRQTDFFTYPEEKRLFMVDVAFKHAVEEEFVREVATLPEAEREAKVAERRRMEREQQNRETLERDAERRNTAKAA